MIIFMFDALSVSRICPVYFAVCPAFSVVINPYPSFFIMLYTSRFFISFEKFTPNIFFTLVFRFGCFFSNRWFDIINFNSLSIF